jgi:hypothetical protein
MNWHAAEELSPDTHIVIVGFPNSKQIEIIKMALINKKINFKFSCVDNMIIIFGIKAKQLLLLNGLPQNINADVLPPPQKAPGGFN